MVRVPLEELVLQIHLLRLGKAGSFLARVLQVGQGKRGPRRACANHKASRRWGDRWPHASLKALLVTPTWAHLGCVGAAFLACIRHPGLHPVAF